MHALCRSFESRARMEGEGGRCLGCILQVALSLLLQLFRVCLLSALHFRVPAAALLGGKVLFRCVLLQATQIEAHPSPCLLSYQPTNLTA